MIGKAGRQVSEAGAVGQLCPFPDQDQLAGLQCLAAAQEAPYLQWPLLSCWARQGCNLKLANAHLMLQELHSAARLGQGQKGPARHRLIGYRPLPALRLQEHSPQPHQEVAGTPSPEWSCSDTPPHRPYDSRSLSFMPRPSSCHPDRSCQGERRHFKHSTHSSSLALSAAPGC